jgi:hypothetical protein
VSNILRTLGASNRRDAARTPHDLAVAFSRIVTGRDRGQRAGDVGDRKPCRMSGVACDTVFDKLARHGTILVVADPTSSIGALPDRSSTGTTPLQTGAQSR